MASFERFPGLDGHTCVTAADYALVYGGKTAARRLNPDVYAMNLTTNDVRRVRCGGTIPPARAFHSAVVWGWRMYVFGGLLAIGVDDVHYNAYNVIANVDALDDSALERPGEQRRRDAAALPRVTQEKREGSSLYALDLEGNPFWVQVHTTGTVPPTRANHQTAIYRSTMYLHGGYSVHTTGRATDEEVKACSLVYALDLNTNVWFVVDTQGTPSPRRWGCSAVLSGDVWLHFGGVDPETGGEENTVDAWHLELGEWRRLPPSPDAPAARALHCGVRWGSHLVAFGGVSAVGSRLSNDVAALDMISGRWTSVAPRGEAPSPRSGHSCCVVGEEMFVVGGLDHAFERSSRWWALNLRTMEWRTVSSRFGPGDLTNIRGLAPVRATAAPRSPPRLRVTVVPTPSARSVATGVGAYYPSDDSQPSDPRVDSSFNARVDASLMRSQPVAGGGSTRHDFDETEVDDTEWRRSDIAKSKSILASMLDSAAARAARESESYVEFDERVPGHHSMPAVEQPTRAHEAESRLRSEVDARIQRLSDVMSTSHADTHDHARSYWKHEIDRLSKENEQWRAAVNREHALMRDVERLHTQPTEARATTRKLIQSGATPQRGHEGVPSSTFSTAATMFPNSSPAPTSGPVTHSDASDPHYEKLRYVPTGRKYVSPSLMKLGLAGQLGQGRRTEMSTAPPRQ